ncbi:MAG: PKD domain-containing protein [Bacteroidales bacterium]|nr:PKD domain-containing protein [Bacteroidales bacterium]
MRTLFTTFMLIFSYFLVAQTQFDLARSIIAQKGQVQISFEEQNSEKVKSLSRIISIEKYQNGIVKAYLSMPQLEKFESFAYNFSIVEPKSTQALNVATSIAQMANWDRYPSYEVYVEMMQQYAENYPNICRLDTIGYSQDGRLILVMKITDNPDVDEYEPEFLYTGQMHGDEIVNYVLFLRLIDELCSNYGSDAEISNIVDNVEIWINPLSNPDGTYNGGNSNVSNSSRYLSNGVDPNRNFPNPVDGDHSDGNPWAQETIDMMSFTANHDFVMSANTHSGAEVVNFPWDSWKSYERVTADDNWWQFVSFEYANLAKSVNSSYLTDVETSGVTEGADWYYAFGSRQDYMNYFAYCRELTLELSSDKLTDSDALPDFWLYNRDSFIAYLKQVMYGIRGIVTDACTYNPIKAKIEILNHDVDNSFVYSSLPVGNFHRLIYAGSYDVVISAEGYASQTFNNISVSNYGTTELNVSLNPLEPIASFEYILDDQCSANYQLINTTPGDVSIEWTLPDDVTSSETSPFVSFTENGTYSITLSAMNCAGNNEFTQSIIVDQLITPPSSTDIERCGPGDVTFTATALGAGELTWYDAENGNIIGTGASYSTSINNNLTVWVEESGELNTYFGAKEDNSGVGTYYNNSTEHALIFDCNQDFILKSVKVYANGAGDREIKLKDNGGVIIYQQTYNLPDGESRIDLNWAVSAGTGYYLQGPSQPNLFRNGNNTSANLPYPYDINGVVSITSNTASSAKYYYYFYDWGIQRGSCSSPQIPVTATVNPLSTAEFTYTQNGADVSFTNASQNANSVSWDFGDGSTNSAELNPEHNYSSNGTFTVTLTAINDCGSDVISYDVIITGVGLNNINRSSVQIFPNPAKQQIKIIAKQHTKPVDVIIYNSVGQNLISVKEYIPEKNIDISQLKSGIYWLSIIGQNETNTLRFIVE